MRGGDSRDEGAGWEGEVAVGDAVDKVERDPLDGVTVQHDEVVLTDQERTLCDQHQALLLIVPVVHPADTHTHTLRP